MAQAILRGREIQELAAIELRVEGDAAIALSIGGAPKIYAHTDPNEDGALVVTGAGGLLVAVADGHGGYEASEIALEHLAAIAETWTAAEWRCSDWREQAIAVFALANAAIRDHITRGGRRLSRTTLAFGLVRPADGWIRFASIGDSHVFHDAPGGVLDLAHAQSHDPIHGHDGNTYFLGWVDETQASLASKCHVGEEPLVHTRALVLVTDGLSERGVGVDEPEEAVAEAVHAAAAQPAPERAGALARGVVEAALAAHKKRRSGDNVAAAAVWLESLRAS
jgi:serine/threonine protein phosphatase PrpC